MLNDQRRIKKIEKIKRKALKRLRKKLLLVGVTWAGKISKKWTI